MDFLRRLGSALLLLVEVLPCAVRGESWGGKGVVRERGEAGFEDLLDRVG
jgi:hypothetical protein